MSALTSAASILSARPRAVAPLLAAGAGAGTWLAAEYLLHRFVGHGRGNSAFATEHRLHHARGSYFAPTRKKVLHVLPVWAVLAAIAVALLGPTAGLCYAVALGVTYAGYELLHRRLHTHAPRGPVGRWLRRHHFLHHFHDPSGNHGVTVHLFDRIGGTLRQPAGQVRVPERLAMSWLLDPATGEVRAEHARDYALVRRSARGLQS
jgi:sterol desaturase/sphingolipid hydroxylase (fatty acid hydroxylase superfamily)